MKEKQENIKLIPHIHPVLSGMYEVTAVQKVSAPKEDTFAAEPVRIYAGYSRFCLEEEDVASIYPPADHSGNYGTTLPHIVLNKKTLPWEHGNGASDVWLALLCLGGEEMEDVETMTLEALSEREPDVFYPQFTLSPAEQKEDSCKMLRIRRTTFETLMPGLEELDYLCHVKDVDMHDKEDEKISHDGLYSVVVANRFVPSGETSDIKSSCYLVSLAGYGPYLRTRNGHAKESIKENHVRLPILFSWNLYSKTAGKAGFRTTFEQLKSGAMDAGRCDLPFLARGYVPLIHGTRTGEETVSLYRGPFTPYDTAEDGIKIRDTFTADGQIVYDPENGMFDMSCAAAWQAGRLMTLQNKSMSVKIFKWRRNLLKSCCKMENDAVRHQHLGEFREGEEEFIDYFFREFYPKLAEGKLTPFAGEEGREKHEVLD